MFCWNLEKTRSVTLNHGNRRWVTAGKPREQLRQQTVKCTQIRLMQLLPALLMLLVLNTTANHAITYTNLQFPVSIQYPPVTIETSVK